MRYAAFAMLITFSCLYARSQVIYIDNSATGAGDGTSWEDAYTDLQDGLTLSVTGDEIWVAAGTYTPHLSDRSVSFQMVDGVNMYGGFAGSETAVDQRVAMANTTVLSGDLNGDDVGFTNNDENSQTVVTGADATLDRFTITGGNANGSGGNSGRFASQRRWDVYSERDTDGFKLHIFV